MVKVSIIIPIYNGELYIVECIKSIQRQTLRDFEILCVDDGSKDQSIVLLKQLQEDEDRIRVWQQSNRGAGSARNFALKKALGEFICFLDVDDCFLSEHALEKLYDSAVEKKALICGGQYYIDKGDGAKKINIYGNLYHNIPNGEFIEYVKYQCDYYYTNYLYSRNMLINSEIIFPEYRQFEDPPFFAKAMYKAGKFYVMDMPFYCYRVRKKQRFFNKIMMKDYLQGMIDNLMFSEQRQLKILHRLTYYRIVNSCHTELMKFYYGKDPIFFDMLKQAKKIIRWEWLREKCNIRECTIHSFATIPENSNICEIKEKNQGFEDWILPTEDIHQGSAIVLYGAGQVGKSFYSQIKQQKYYSLCAWVDNNFEEIDCIGDQRIFSPKELYILSFDYILIAVARTRVALEIMEELVISGIPPEKIIWNIWG